MFRESCQRIQIMFNDEEIKIGKFFDDCAKEGLMEKFSQDEISKLHTLINMWGIKPGDRIMEPGCGSGRLTVYLADLVGETGEVYAFDLSKEMITKAKNQDLSDQVQFEVGTVSDIQKHDCYFQKVICMHTFPHFPDQEKSLIEIARVLQDGGDLWISHLDSRKGVNERHQNSDMVIAHHLLHESDEMKKLLEKTGFEVKTIKDTEDEYFVHAVKK